MARKATGSVVERQTSDGDVSFQLRFRAYGKRRAETLGTKSEGWSRPKAEEALANVLADVRRGIWQPHEPEPVETSAAVPTFHEFASDWLRAKEPELREKTVVDYRWSLELHLLPYFASMRLDAISIEDVDRYRAAKLREGKLAPNSVNKTIVRLASVLETAQEYGHVERNVAAGRRRRAKPTRPKRSWVLPEQLPTLLDGADSYMRPIIATLAGAGLRIGELCALDWRDANLATGTLIVRESKTAAGEGREVDLSPALREELAEWRARSPRTRPTDPVFVSRERHGKHARQTPRNVQARLRTAVKAANECLAELGIEQIGSVSPHGLRRSYASLRAELGDNMARTSRQLGHRDIRFTANVYTQVAGRREKLSGHYLTQFDAALDWARMGTKADSVDVAPVPAPSAEDAQTASRS
jgi:integrase